LRAISIALSMFIIVVCVGALAGCGSETNKQRDLRIQNAIANACGKAGVANFKETGHAWDGRQEFAVVCRNGTVRVIETGNAD
jgi:hypothetical protein